MERFCPKCGSLVEGTGAFCPSCGERLESAVSLEKPDVMPSTSQGIMPGTSDPIVNNTASNTYSQNSHTAQMPNYPQSYNSVSAPAEEMTVGQWVLTIFLSSLGIIGIILLFVWAFGSSEPTAKKNYARAMLIWEAIALGIVILFYAAMFACSFGMLGTLFDDMYYNYAMIGML
ncbi:MAG: zinc ribbon domain-containing protein [Oscillospiraceae bacterium]|nr:zinc ribbon domain-containing protein [Oscillospiraceae bacterium]